MFRLFIELGLVIIGLAILARIATRGGFSAIPVYLLAGLAFGKGGLAPIDFSQEFIRIGAEIGVLLLLFMLGLEYTGAELKENLRGGTLMAVIDFGLNFPPGFVTGLMLGWKPLPAVLLGGVTYVSSSGIIARVLGELRRLGNPETSVVLSILVMEDLTMAVYLPLVGVLLVGGGPVRMAVSIAIAVAVVAAVLLVAIRHGGLLSRIAAHESDEIILLTLFGTLLLVAGGAELVHVSAAIGAFLVGIAVSGPVAEQAHRIFAPLRDLFAATFFFFFGLEINPHSLVPALPLAVVLAVATAFTKTLTGYWAAPRDLPRDTRIRAGAALIARGEFSIVIAGLGVAVEPALGPLSAAYVLLTAIAGPIVARLT
ncbi:MAG: cation:proton antiporter [Acidobacteriia bacterium]|nr:cation:proton antiporter [Terriglobia bacterium]